jgi:hypothetical protein
MALSPDGHVSNRPMALAASLIASLVTIVVSIAHVRPLHGLINNEAEGSRVSCEDDK